MTKKTLLDCCLSYPGAWLDYPFGPVPAVVKVGRKMFAIISPETEPISIALKCEPDMAARLRNEYPSVKPGYHLNKQHWNTVVMDGTIPSGLWQLMIAMSYELVVKTMTKAEKRANSEFVGFQKFKSGGDMQLDKIQLVSADEYFYRAILAYANEKYAVAIQEAQLASAMAPDDLLYREAVNYLQRVAAAGKAGVYATPEGFTEFIRSGGNVKLYERTSQLLSDCYSGFDQLKLLDIGVGDGRALLPALTGNIAQLDVLEPSATMLDCCKLALSEKKVNFNATCGTLQDYTAAHGAGRWDVVQATFSLQSIQSDERQELLGWISARCDRLLIAEFDVPEFTTLYEPERLQHMVSRYRNGLQEYAGDGGLVAQGFLLPVFFGYFDRSAARTNYEQKIDNWCAQLQNAGFSNVTKRLIYPYWWADAYLIEASHC